MGIPLGAVHFCLGIAALAVGLAVVLTVKGSVSHRTVGRVYAVTMLLLNATALGIYRLYDYFGPFHVAAVISIATLVAGYVPVFLRRPRKGWLELHGYFMSWSYVGLLAAFASEVAVRTLRLRIWPTTIVVTIAVIVAGAVLISLRVPKVLKILNRH